MSSSSSLLDSSTYGSDLGASKWNREKAERPIRGRPLLWAGGSADGNADNSMLPDADAVDHIRHLTTKRHYPTSSPFSSAYNNLSSSEQSKTRLERAVLVDCLSSHFLCTHLSKNEVDRLCDGFIKHRFRDHEIIYSKGSEAKYLYILYSGEVVRRNQDEQTNDDDDLGPMAEKYTVLGELALLSNSPHKETVQATSDCDLFCLAAAGFHSALRPTSKVGLDDRIALLQSAIPDEIKDHFLDNDVKQLTSAMTILNFVKGDTLVGKETRLGALVIIAKGTVVAKDVSMGNRTYEDQRYGQDAPKLSFGWQSLLAGSNEPTFRGSVIAETDGVALILQQSSFRGVMGGDETITLQHLAAKRLARIELQQLPVFKDSQLGETQIHALLDMMHRCEYATESAESEGSDDTTPIFQAGDRIEPALYFVREGTVTLVLNKGEDQKIVEAGDFFGEQNMLRDQNKGGKKHISFRSPMTALAHGPRTVVDVLYLEECRNIVDTSRLGLASPLTETVAPKWMDIHRHVLLGSGSFGKVWLASIDREENKRIVALKVQSKHQIVSQAGKAERMVAERNILSSLHSPFLLELVSAFQDHELLYMITTIVQGGELESLIPDDGLSESSAKFYAAAVLEGLAYLHRRHLIHRDIKPQNILINERGYPVLIDFGFCKYVPDKTYTFLGSPIFTAPEIIRYQGYDASCDYWAWAVLVYRLVTGKYPFYEKGIDELNLYKRICKGSFELDGLMSMEFRMLICTTLYPDPKKRLGSGRNGWRNIVKSPWFVTDGPIDFQRLRRQEIQAPWVPDLKDPLDASSFHPDESEMEDLLHARFPDIAEKQQDIFEGFGPQIEE